MGEGSWLRGRTVLVTGATGGLGPAVVAELAERGARLAAHGTDEAKACRLAGTLEGAEGFGGDLMDETAAARLVARVEERAGPVEGLVHLVGGYTGGTVERSGLAAWERMLALNLHSAVVAIRAVLPGMLARRSGRIVTVGAKAALGSGAGVAAYAASKAALLKLTEALSEEVRDAGIRVNAVVPSTIDTPANREAMPRADASAWVPPAELARAIAFLLESEAVSGAALKVYGRS